MHWGALCVVTLLAACNESVPPAPKAMVVVAQPKPPIELRCSIPSVAYRPQADQLALHRALEARNFDELEQKLTALREALNKQYCSDRPFDLAFKGLQDGAPGLETAFDSWIERKPSSAYALAARGLHFVARGETARGVRFASKTKQDRFERLRTHLEQAQGDLVRALELEPSFSTAGAGLLDIARHALGAKAGVALYGKLAASAPASYVLPATLLYGLSPKWGGSDEALRKMASVFMQRAPENPDLAMLPSLAECLVADSLWSRDQELAAMVLFVTTQKKFGERFAPNCWIYQGRTERSLDRSADAVASYAKYFDSVGFRVGVDEVESELIALGRQDEAATLFEHALAINQGDPDLYCGYADLMYAQKKYRRAKELIEAGLAVLPDSPDCVRTEARLSRTLGNDPAKRVARLASIAEDSTDQAGYHLELGRALIAQKKYRDAVSPLNRAAELDDRNSMTFYYRALAHEGSGDFSSALEDATRALTLQPGEAVYWSARGRLRVANGTALDSAVADLKEAIGRGNDDPDVWYALAGAYYKLKDCEVLPSVREYQRRCTPQSCNSTALAWAEQVVNNPEFRTECPQKF